jgi:hypothetical protein
VAEANRAELQSTVPQVEERCGRGVTLMPFFRTPLLRPDLGLTARRLPSAQTNTMILHTETSRQNPAGMVSSAATRFAISARRDEAAVGTDPAERVRRAAAAVERILATLSTSSLPTFRHRSGRLFDFLANSGTRRTEYRSVHAWIGSPPMSLARR